MPRVIYNTATTLNGFLADDDHSLEWLFAVPGAEAAEDEFPGFLDSVGVIVMGSSTYQWILEHEQLLTHPEKWAQYYGERPVWVFTSRDLPIVSGVPITLASGDVSTAWPRLQEQAGDRDVWVTGGGDLAGQFADAGLLDEVRVSIAPALLPSGKPLLPRRIGADRLTLRSTRQLGQFAELVYSVTP